MVHRTEMKKTDQTTHERYAAYIILHTIRLLEDPRCIFKFALGMWKIVSRDSAVGVATGYRLDD
jgi:hypothetical protein